MLSRNLGAKWGGAIGICFYLANTYGTVLYLLGSIEILLVSVAVEAIAIGVILAVGVAVVV